MKKGFACGVFDLFHLGHVLMLEQCKQNCEHLTIAINRAENFSEEINPGKRMPVFSADERGRIMTSVKFVDEVIFYNSEEELQQILTEGHFDIRFLGEDYRGKPITGAGIVKEIFYIDRSHGYSTTAVLQKILNRYHKKD